MVDLISSMIILLGFSFNVHSSAHSHARICTGT